HAADRAQADGAPARGVDESATLQALHELGWNGHSLDDIRIRALTETAKKFSDMGGLFSEKFGSGKLESRLEPDRERPGLVLSLLGSALEFGVKFGAGKVADLLLEKLATPAVAKILKVATESPQVAKAQGMAKKLVEKGIDKGLEKGKEVLK